MPGEYPKPQESYILINDGKGHFKNMTASYLPGQASEGAIIRLYRLDHQYVVQDGEVIIVDDFTGRLMKGRRWSDGLHQAVEAKEEVKIERENQTLATITLQNYFRLYEKLSGMTGTAETEAGEFHSTYKLEVIVIPTHMPMVRKDNPDLIYRTLPEKWDAVVEEIQERYEVASRCWSARCRWKTRN